VSRATPPPLDDAALRDIEARLNRASPGPWIHRDQFIETAEEPSQLLGVTMQRNEEGLTPLPGNDNARFIAHARGDVERLLHEVRRLRAGQDAT
jgi:hypothetical protein